MKINEIGEGTSKMNRRIIAHSLLAGSGEGKDGGAMNGKARRVRSAGKGYGGTLSNRIRRAPFGGWS